MIDSMMQRIPNVPGCSAGSVGGVSVAIVDGGDMATVVTALPAELLTAAECRRAAALLLEAADALGSASPAPERGILADPQAAAARKLLTDPAAAPEGLLFLPSGAKWAEVDSELHAVGSHYLEKAKLARASAKRYRDRGDLARWRKACAVARVWEMAHDSLWMVACPF